MPSQETSSIVMFIIFLDHDAMGDVIDVLDKFSMNIR